MFLVIVYTKKLTTVKNSCQLLNSKNYSSPTNGSNPMIRARLIATVNLRWFLAPVPVTRRGKIFPRSEMNFLSIYTSLYSLNSTLFLVK